MEASPKKKITPFMRQWDEAKSVQPDAVLFFRMGDFYETFHQDAVLVARELNLTLTARDKDQPEPTPMAGVPHHAAAGYVARLLAKGYKVAICEQMADPSKVKGIVPRQVVRVVTPGTVTETDQLDARANHYLAAVDAGEATPGTIPGQGSLGVALLDLSTGELAASVVPDSAALLVELSRADPREILFSKGLAEVRAAISLSAPRAALRDDDELASADVEPAIDDAVEEPLFATARTEHPPLALRAAARVLRFARRCTPGARLPVRRIVRHDPGGALRIDETAQVHLELVRASDGGRTGSLLDVIDATVTPAGARLLRRRLLSPLVDVHAIRMRLDQVDLFVQHARARDELREALAGVGDLERLAVRAALREATPRELGHLRDGLLAAPRAAAAVKTIPDPAAAELLETDIDVVADLAQKLVDALVDRPPPHAREGGVVREGFDKKLDELTAVKKNGAELVAKLEVDLRTQTGAASLKVKYNSVFGYYIEVTKSHLSKVPKAWRRKQTIAGGERYTNDELDELADKIEHAEARALEIETEVWKDLLSAAASASDRIKKLARALAEWDVASALADLAHRHDYERPVVDGGDVIALEDGRHPVVERFAAAGRFVPNDAQLDLAGERLWLITGPNMAGKSTFMRQVALTVILAQMGSYVPAKRARIGVVDRILSRVGASDNVARGESTFMVEMRETAGILREATRRSLVILDEIGRGTSTYDGLSIAWAVAEHLHDVIGCRALFATHYHELTELAKQASGIANHSVAAREHGDDVVFLHKLVPGPASRSYGIAVARLAGIGEGVLARAKAILGTLESGAALPGGRHASLRGKSKAGTVQLDLFAPKAEAAAGGPVIDTLKVVDVERLTPLDALALVVKLKAMASQG
ncbi:DNA mismatch repair protein MutS [Minicystis rosea]|nr:DNA mismatch repair protein MutS [Minicystis rosea]